MPFYNISLKGTGSGTTSAGGGNGGSLMLTVVPWPDSSNNSGVLTENHDNTNHINFYRWTSGSAGQDYDLVLQFKIPTGFTAFPAGAISLKVRSNNAANNPLTISLYDGSGTVDPGVDGADIKPASNNTWTAKTDTPTATYAVGDICHLHIHMGNQLANDTVDAGDLYISFT